MPKTKIDDTQKHDPNGRLWQRYVIDLVMALGSQQGIKISAAECGRLVREAEGRLWRRAALLGVLAPLVLLLLLPCGAVLAGPGFVAGFVLLWMTLAAVSLFIGVVWLSRPVQVRLSAVQREAQHLLKSRLQEYALDQQELSPIFRRRAQARNAISLWPDAEESKAKAAKRSKASFDKVGQAVHYLREQGGYDPSVDYQHLIEIAEERLRKRARATRRWWILGSVLTQGALLLWRHVLVGEGTGAYLTAVVLLWVLFSSATLGVRLRDGLWWLTGTGPARDLKLHDYATDEVSAHTLWSLLREIKRMHAERLSLPQMPARIELEPFGLVVKLGDDGELVDVVREQKDGSQRRPQP